jgi:hypothetical protein
LHLLARSDLNFKLTLGVILTLGTTMLAFVTLMIDATMNMIFAHFVCSLDFLLKSVAICCSEIQFNPAHTNPKQIYYMPAFQF